MISVIVTIHPTSSVTGEVTVADVRQMLSEARLLGVPESTQLLDGGHCYVEVQDGTRRLLAQDRATMSTRSLADVEVWLEGLADSLKVVYGSALAVDVPGDVLAEPAMCGDHVGEEPYGLVVSTDPLCRRTHKERADHD